MLINEQIKLAKGAVLGLLTRAYQQRHRVGVIVFRDTRAEVILPPTSSITRARNALQAVAAGGGTPFAGGLQAVLRVVSSERIRHPNDIQQMILITDGRPSITMQPGADMREEVLYIARQFPARNIPAIVLVTEDTCDLIREAALELKAPLHKISDVVLQMQFK
jgi:magnesium chelatase subunit D